MYFLLAPRAAADYQIQMVRYGRFWDAALSAALVVAPEVAAPRRGGWPGRPEGVSTVAFVQIQNVIEPAYEAWECYMLASDASQSENKVTDWISSLQLGQVSHYTCLKISPQEIAC